MTSLVQLSLAEEIWNDLHLLLSENIATTIAFVIATAIISLIVYTIDIIFAYLTKNILYWELNTHEKIHFLMQCSG
jgi:hypothetical protein